MKRDRSIRKLLAASGEAWATLADLDPAATHGMDRKRATRDLEADAGRLLDLQTRLYAENRRSLLVILQGMDTSGKDGTISHVIGQLNPSGVSITSFKQPTPEERRHSFLWRIRRALPGPGQIAIFNRSQYEDVLVARVNRLAAPAVIERRYGQINRFEAGLAAAGTPVLKFFLHISPEEQRERLLNRLDRPDKRWKFSPGDLEVRARWAAYQAAYELVLRRCSAPAPWYVIPADHKWFRNWAISRILMETLQEMDPRYPKPRLDLRRLEGRLRAESEEGHGRPQTGR